MSNVSELVIRYTFNRPASELMVGFPELPEGFSPEVIHADQIAARFFDAFDVAEYFRTRADIDNTEFVSYFELDGTEVEHLNAAFNRQIDGFDYLPVSNREFDAIESLRGDDERGSVSQLRAILPLLVSLSRTPGVTIFYHES